MTQILTETLVAHEVDAILDEQECLVHTCYGPHGGPITVFVDQHGCKSGYVCADHVTSYLSEFLNEPGQARCRFCNKLFESTKDIISVYPVS